MRFLVALLVLLLWPASVSAQMQAAIPNFGSGAASTVVAGSTETWTGSRQIAGWVYVRGTLVLAGHLTATGVYVDVGGFFDVQSGSLTINNTPINLSADPRQWGNGLLVFGRVRMMGVEKVPFFRLAAEALAGQSTLTLSTAPLTWAVGDEVFLPDTRQVPPDDWFNAGYALRHETRTIAAINGVTVTLSVPLAYDHRGAKDANGFQQPGFLPHVANLTRSITVRSALPTGTRGHVVLTDRANVEIRGVAFRDMGRTTVAATSDQDNSPNQIGRYPMHVHMHSGPVNPTNTGYQFTLVGNVIRDTLKWPLAIHGSHYGLVENNVIIGGAQFSGAGIALEDGTETDNLIRGNFVADIRGNEDPRNTGTGNPSDGNHAGTGGECIWGAGFNNRFVNNVVTGCRNPAQNVASGVGFKFFVVADTNSNNRLNPRFRGADMGDPAQTVAVNLQRQALLEHRGNEAYGLMADGITIWDLGTDGYSNTHTAQAESLIQDFKVWHAYEGLVFHYPVNNIRFLRPSFRVDYAQDRKPAAFVASDYRVINQTVEDGDFHAGAVLSGYFTDPLGSHVYRNNRATTYGHAFNFQTPATPGTGAGRPQSGVTVSLIENEVTPWPGRPVLRYSFRHTPNAFANADTDGVYTLNVTEGGNNFRICAVEQATQNLYGGTCPGATTRADIEGIVVGGSAPPPPPPPAQEICGDGLDNDNDGQIDEGCTPTPPPSCTTIQVAPSSVTWTVQQGSVPPATAIAVTTCNGAAWSTNDTSPFYGASLACYSGTGGSCQSGGSTTLTPYASVAALSPQTLTAPLSIMSPGLTTVTVPVTLTVTSAAPPPPPPPQEICGNGVDDDLDGQIDEGCQPQPPPPPTDPCVADPLRVTRIAWPSSNTGRRSLTFDVGTKQWATFTMIWPGTLTVTDTRGCSATVSR